MRFWLCFVHKACMHAAYFYDFKHALLTFVLIPFSCTIFLMFCFRLKKKKQSFSQEGKRPDKKKKKLRRTDGDLDTGLSLMDDEAIALKLLNSWTRKHVRMLLFVEYSDDLFCLENRNGKALRRMHQLMFFGIYNLRFVDIVSCSTEEFSSWISVRSTGLILFFLA